MKIACICLLKGSQTLERIADLRPALDKSRRSSGRRDIKPRGLAQLTHKVVYPAVTGGRIHSK